MKMIISQPPDIRTRSFNAGTRAILLCLGGMMGAALLSANPFVGVACVLAFALIWYGALASPLRTVMAAYLTLQWLQVVGGVLLANFYGADMGEPQSLHLTPTNLTFSIKSMSREAVLFGLAAISLLSLGFRLVPGTARPLGQLDLPYRRLTLLAGYFLLLLLHLIAGPLVGGGFAQPLIVLGQLRLFFAALLFYKWALDRSGGAAFSAVIAIELIVGFSGFFSGFKQIFFVITIALLTLAPIRWKQVWPLLGAAAASMLVLGTVWTAIKVDYRSALNQGTGTQEVMISLDERLDTLQNLLANTSGSNLQSSSVHLAARMAYTDFLAIVLNRVPEVQPHAEGAIWGEAVQNVLVPRFLYPDKPVMQSTSELTMRYTGLRLASTAEGTSISMGYAADTYVDFGFFGAALVFLLMGVGYGFATSFVVSRFQRRDFFAAIGSAITLLAPAAAFESSIVGMLAGFLWAFIVTAAFASFVWPLFRDFQRAQATSLRPTAPARPLPKNSN